MMDLELKNIKVMSSLSRETYCFSADLFVNGKKTAIITNDGHGGSDNVTPVSPFTYEYVEVVNEYISQNFSASYSSKYDILILNSLEIWSSNQISKSLTKKELTKHLKKYVVVLSEKTGEIEFYQFHEASKIDFTDPKVLEKIQEETNSNVILNAMPFDDALEIYSIPKDSPDCVEFLPVFDDDWVCINIPKK
jgi:hypothetical protein